MTHPSILSETARALKPGEFRGHCARGHDRLDFTDQQAWVEHHKAVHGRRQHKPGEAHPVTPGVPRLQWEGRSPWGPGPCEPRPWKAPGGKAPDLTRWVESGDLFVEKACTCQKYRPCEVCGKYLPRDTP